MKSPRTVSSVLTLSAIAASAIAVHFYLETIDLRRQLDMAQRIAVDGGSEAGAKPTASAVASGVSTPTPGEDGGAGVRGDPPAREVAGARDERRARWVEMAGRLARDPEARVAMLGRMKSEVDRVYGDLFVKLGLSEDQVDMLRSLLAERQMVRMEGEMASRFAADDAARAAARAASSAREQSIESGITALLGPDGLALLDDFQRSQPMRQAVGEVARRASYAVAPLSGEAGERLVAAMQAAAREYPAGSGGGGRREPLTQQAVDAQLAAVRAQNEAVLVQAREFLNEAQIEALVARQIEEYEQIQARLNVRLRNPNAPFFGGGPGGLPPGP